MIQSHFQPPKHGDGTTSQGSLFRCLTTLTGETFFHIYCLNLSLCLLSLILTSCTTEEPVSVFFVIATVILTARPRCVEWVIHSAVNLSMPRPVPCTRGSTTPTALPSESAARVHESIVSVLTVGVINFLRKCYNSLNDWKKWISTMDGVCMACCTWFEVLFNARPLRIPSIWKDVSLSMLFSSYSLSCNK